MATIVTLIVSAIIVLFLGLIAGAVEGFYNQILGEGFRDFNGLINFIPNLIANNGGSVDLGSAIQFAAFAMMITVVVISVTKSMFTPSVGKESENPANILIRSVIASIGIFSYPLLINDLLIKNMNQLLQVSGLFLTSIPEGTLGNAWNIGSAVFSSTVIINIIFYFAIFIALITASVTYIERYLSFALYIILGPFCIAFYPASENKSITTEWVKGILSQVFGIFISLFALSLVGYSLISMKDNTNVFMLAVTLALLSFVKNSEKFVNMLGLRTMPNLDTARNFMTGVMGFAALGSAGRAVYNGYRSGKQAYENGKDLLNKFKGNDFNIPSQYGNGSNPAMNYNRIYGDASSYAEGFNNKRMKESNLYGTKFADHKASETKMFTQKDGNIAANKIQTLPKKDFEKMYNDQFYGGRYNGVGGKMLDGVISKVPDKIKDKIPHSEVVKARNEAYDAYVNRTNLANDAREKMVNEIRSQGDNLAPNSVLSGAEFAAATGIGASGHYIPDDAKISIDRDTFSGDDATVKSEGFVYKIDSGSVQQKGSSEYSKNTSDYVFIGYNKNSNEIMSQPSYGEARNYANSISDTTNDVYDKNFVSLGNGVSIVSVSKANFTKPISNEPQNKQNKENDKSNLKDKG